MPAGYFDGSLDVYGVDNELVSANIKKGVEIFGINGSNISSIGFKGEVSINLSGGRPLVFYRKIKHNIINEFISAEHHTDDAHYFISFIDYYKFSTELTTKFYTLKAMVAKYKNDNNDNSFSENNLIYGEHDEIFPSPCNDENNFDNGPKYIKISGNWIYFIKRVSKCYVYIVYDIETWRFLEGESENMPGVDPNNIHLIINGRRWYHKAELTEVISKYKYGYCMWLSTYLN